MNTQTSPERLKGLLKDLVDIYSPTGKEEEVLEYVREYLTRCGLKPVVQAVDENRYNLIVLPENGKEIELFFIGHLDTVSAYDLEDYGFRQEGDNILGLGTADMKAGCAAMIEAFTVLAETGNSFPPVGLALVVGEEEDNQGTRVLLKKYKFPWAVIGEPTSLAPCPGHYAYLEMLLRTRGIRAHAAVPETGQNAIESMLRLLLEMTDYLASRKNGLVYNIKDMTGFPGGFIVPDACEAWIDIHLPPDIKMDSLKRGLRRLLKRANRDINEPESSLEFTSTYPGYRIDQNEVMLKKLRNIFRRVGVSWEPQDFRSHSDGNILYLAGIKTIILGPGKLEAAHTPEEWVSFKQSALAAEIYLQLAASL